MTRDMDESLDPELEQLGRRLGSIATGQGPEMPARITRYAAQVAGERSVGIGDSDLVMQRVRRPSLLPRPGRAAFALATVAMVAAVGAASLVALRPNATTSTNPGAPAQWGGLQWRDITATAFPAVLVSGVSSSSIVYWHGAYYANPAATLWSSPDGVTWHKVQDAPGAIEMAATNDLLVLDDGGCTTAINYTTDVQSWNTAVLPLHGAVCSGIASLAATPSAVVAVMEQIRPDNPLTAAVAYRSTDGAAWTATDMPAGMAGAVLGIRVSEGRTGFLAAGLLPMGSWYSGDGTSWGFTTLPGDAGDFATSLVLQRGSLGDWVDAGGQGYHTLDDLTWIHDNEPAAFSRGPLQVSSDGTWILAQTPGPAFYVGRGDGTWRQIVNRGDTGELSDGGQSWIMRAGVLYVGNGHVFFGTPIQG